MNQKLKKPFTVAILFIILAITIYEAVVIGDKAAGRGSYKTLKVVLRLAEPIHSSLHHLQLERSLATFFLTTKRAEDLENLKQQFPKTNSALTLLRSRVARNDILLIALKREDVLHLKTNLEAYREKILSDSVSAHNSTEFYTSLNNELHKHLTDLYQFGDSKNTSALTEGLISVLTLKEQLDLERGQASALASKENMEPGELVLIKETLQKEEGPYENLNLINDPSLRKLLIDMSKSPENKEMMKARGRFLGKTPIFSGSLEKGKEYFQTSTDYLNLFLELENHIISRLNKLCNEGLEKLKEEIILNISAGCLLILLLLGLYFVVTKNNLTE